MNNDLNLNNDSYNEDEDKNLIREFDNDINKLFQLFILQREKNPNEFEQDNIKSQIKQIFLIEKKKISVNYINIILLILKFSSISLNSILEIDINKLILKNNSSKGIIDQNIITQIINFGGKENIKYTQSIINSFFEIIFIELFGLLDIQINKKTMKKVISFIIELTDSQYKNFRYYGCLIIMILYSNLLEEYKIIEKNNSNHDELKEKANLIDVCINTLNEKWFLKKSYLYETSNEIRELIGDYIYKICKFSSFNFKIIFNEDLIRYFKLLLSDPSNKVKCKYLYLLYEIVKRLKTNEIKRKLITILSECHLILLNSCVDKEKQISKISMKILDKLAKQQILDPKILSYLSSHLYCDDIQIRDIVTKICIKVILEYDKSKIINDDDNDSETNNENGGSTFFNNEISDEEDESNNKINKIDNNLSKSFVKHLKYKKKIKKEEEELTASNFLILSFYLYEWSDGNDIFIMRQILSNYQRSSIKKIFCFSNYYTDIMELLFENFSKEIVELNEFSSNFSVEKIFNHKIGKLEISPIKLFETISKILLIQIEYFGNIMIVNLNNTDKYNSIKTLNNKFIFEINEKFPNLIKMLSSHNYLKLTNILFDIISIIKFNSQDIVEIVSIDMLKNYKDILSIISEHSHFSYFIKSFNIQNFDFSMNDILNYHQSLFNFCKKLIEFEKYLINDKEEIKELIKKYFTSKIEEQFHQQIKNNLLEFNKEKEEKIIIDLINEFYEKTSIDKKKQKSLKNHASYNFNEFTNNFNIESQKQFISLLNLIKELIDFQKDNYTFLIDHLSHEKSQNFIVFLICFIKSQLKIIITENKKNIKKESNIQINILENCKIGIQLSFTLIENILFILLNACINKDVKLIYNDEYCSLRKILIDYLINFLNINYSEEKSIINDLLLITKTRSIICLFIILTYNLNSLIPENIFLDLKEYTLNIEKNDNILEEENIIFECIRNFIEYLMIYFKNFNGKFINENSIFYNDEYTIKLESTQFIVEYICKLMLINYEISSYKNLCLIFFEFLITINYNDLISHIIYVFYERFFEKEIAYSELYFDKSKSILLQFSLNLILLISNNKSIIFSIKNYKIVNYFSTLSSDDLEKDKLSCIKKIIEFYNKTIKKIKNKYSSDKLNPDRIDYILKDSEMLVLFLINSINMGLMVDEDNDKKGNKYLNNNLKNQKYLILSFEIMKNNPLLDKDQYKYILKKTLNNINCSLKIENLDSKSLKAIENIKNYLIKKADVYLLSENEYKNEQIKENVNVIKHEKALIETNSQKKISKKPKKRKIISSNKIIEKKFKDI